MPSAVGRRRRLLSWRQRPPITSGLVFWKPGVTTRASTFPFVSGSAGDMTFVVTIKFLVPIASWPTFTGLMTNENFQVAGYRLAIDTDGGQTQMRGDNAGNSTQASWTHGTFFNDLKKHLLIGRYNPAGNAEVYCDDVQRAVTGSAITPVQVSTLTYGLAGGNIGQCELSNGMAFNRVLSTAEMTLLFGLMK